MCCHALLRIDCQATFNEFAGGEGDRTPIFERSEGIVGDQDGLHFFEIGVPVKGGVAAEEEVGYYAYCPDVSEMGISSRQNGIEGAQTLVSHGRFS